MTKFEYEMKLVEWRRQRDSEGYWTEHKDHPLADWRYEVANDDTRESYDEWVVNRIEQDFFEEQDSE